MRGVGAPRPGSGRWHLGLLLAIAALLVVPATNASAAAGPQHDIELGGVPRIAVRVVLPGQDHASILPGRHIARTAWLTDPRGRRLAVYPTDYGRYRAPAAQWQEAWDEVVQRRPEVDHRHIRDQFRCHVEFARIAEPDKPSWNLELWRDDVGYLATVTARCNP